MNELLNIYTIDLNLKPTTFDLWHVCLAGTVAVLALLLITLLLGMVLAMSKRKQPLQPTIQTVTVPGPPPPPEIKVVEKIVEVEKIVQAPAPEPIVLKETTPDAALQLLGLLQSEARFLDFIKENITNYSDEDIGIAARVVHGGCNKVINDHFNLSPIRNEAEGSTITVPKGFNANEVRLTGNIIGNAPFSGTLIHKGWKITETKLPKLTQGHNANIIAAAEIEL